MTKTSVSDTKRRRQSHKRSRRPAQRWLQALLPVLGVVLLLVILEVASRILGGHRLPSMVDDVIPEMFTLLFESQLLEFQGGGSEGLLPHLLYTVGFTVLGTVVGALLAIVTALAMTRFSWLNEALRLPIDIFRTIPPLAAIPFLLIWVGPGTAAELGLLIFYTFVVVVVGTLNALANLDQVVYRFARTLGASENRAFLTVTLPSVVPGIIGTLRVALGSAWGIQIVGEMLAGSRGMGQVFARVMSFQALDIILVGILWITIVAVMTDRALVFVAHRVTRWAP